MHIKIFEKLIKRAKNKQEIPATMIEITKTLANLATNKLLKSEILKIGGIDILLDQLSSENLMLNIPPDLIPKVDGIDLDRFLKEGDLNKEIMRFYRNLC